MKAVVLGLGGLVVLAAAASVVSSRASAGLETPAYEVLRADGAFELRRYPEMVVASIDRTGSRGAAVQAGFSPLARYIFARDRAGPKIAMTAPVLQGAGERGWTVSFIMPSAMAREDLPLPNGDVRLEDVPARVVAAVTFTGFWRDGSFDTQAERLRAWLAAEGVSVTGAPEYGYYNDPFTLPFLRRNEVLLEVAGDDFARRAGS